MAFVEHIRGGEDFADINENRSGERIGERIKKIRITREMTRAELGALVGLDQNRVQQYENGKRKPKIPLLKKFAWALGVETIALMDPIPDSYIGAMHALFQMEENLNLKIVMKDGCYCLQFGDGKLDGINPYLRKWYEIRRELDDALPDLTGEDRKKKIFDYNMFEWTYPTGTARNVPKQFNEHPINRMQELQEDHERSMKLTEEIKRRRAQEENNT